MTTLVLPRLYAGWWPRLRAFGIVSTAIGFGLIASMMRSAMVGTATLMAASAALEAPARLRTAVTARVGRQLL